MKSKRKLAKELLKVVKNNGNYQSDDYWYQEDEYIEVATDREIIAIVAKFLKKGSSFATDM
jgi:23S rRNA maturation-related 3'-5' exoribonuclease YhaM